MTDPNPDPLELSIIVVTYNSRRHVRDCLESIQQTAGDIGHEVIVVDNASQDGTPDIIRNEFLKARLIANPENLGFARGGNQGITQSQGRYILLLNPDTIVPPKTLATVFVALPDFRNERSIGSDPIELLRECRKIDVPLADLQSLTVQPAGID